MLSIGENIPLGCIPTEVPLYRDTSYQRLGLLLALHF